MAAKAIPRILIQAPLQNILNRRMLDGVLTYANAHGPWSINILQEGDTPFSREIAAWRPTAFMAFLEESAEATDFSELKIPSVFVNPPDNVRLPQRPRPAVIRRDYEALGRTAANYFIRRGHVSFAFVPNLRNAVRSEAICRGFADAVRAVSGSFAAYAGADFGQLAGFLRRLPKPVAVLTPSDARAKRLLDVCLVEGLSVPSDVSVLGMGNDAVMCETSVPPLSSLDIYAKATGTIAAETLDRLLHGQLKRRLQPISHALVFPRTSTDLRRLDDALVTRVIAHIEANAGTPLRTDDLALRFNVSRRTLETRVRKALGHALGVEIENARIERAKALLKTTDLTLAEIASRCGFHDASHFVLRFRTRLGLTPSAYRAGR